jgi:hypothetical protein
VKERAAVGVENERKLGNISGRVASRVAVKMLTTWVGKTRKARIGIVVHLMIEEKKNGQRSRNAFFK